MKQIKELHCHLFREEMDFDDQFNYLSVVDGFFLMNRKNRCSHEIQKDDQLSKNEIYKNNFFKKNAAKKQTKKSLTFEKSKRIFGVFYIFTLTNIKRPFFSLNRVPKSRGKGTKIQGIEANFSPNPLKVAYFTKMAWACFEFKMIKNSKMSRFNIRQKGTKIQGMSVSEYEKKSQGTKIQGKGTKIRGKGTTIRGKGTIFGGALIEVSHYG